MVYMSSRRYKSSTTAYQLYGCISVSWKLTGDKELVFHAGVGGNVTYKRKRLSGVFCNEQQETVDCKHHFNPTLTQHIQALIKLISYMRSFKEEGDLDKL